MGRPGIRRAAAPPILGGALLSLLGPIAAAGGSADVAQITEPPSKGGGRLSSGGSSTPFHLKLPSGAACTGDSAHRNYRVQSYMVPAADVPSGLSFRSQGPTGPGQRPLYDIFTRSYVNVQTANAEPEDAAGLIVNVPLFSYAVYPPGIIAPGPWDVGIACTLAGQVDRFWNARIEVSSTASDKPAGFTWKQLDGPGTGGSSRASVWVVVAGAAVVGAGGFFALRSRRVKPVRSGRSRSDALEESR